MPYRILRCAAAIKRAGENFSESGFLWDWQGAETESHLELWNSCDGPRSLYFESIKKKLFETK